MIRTKILWSAAAVTVLVMLAASVSARTRLPNDSDLVNPPGQINQALEYCVAEHNIGRLVLAVNNNGTFGTGFTVGSSTDCFTGARVLSCEYPKGSNTRYNFSSAFWVGSVVGRDTLVSIGADGWIGNYREFNPIEPMVYRSIIDPTSEGYDSAVSEQDFVAVYVDTFTSGVTGLQNDPIDGRPHTPLGIKVTERSFAWSYSYAQDFILFDYAIENVSINRLRRVFMGVYCDADVHPESADGQTASQDDVCGFVYDLPTPPEFVSGCDNFRDTVFIAWIADNDGDPEGTDLNSPTSVPNVTGMRIVRTPADTLDVSFNWWISNGSAALDYGPQTRKMFRDLSTGGQGTPEGKNNKYWYLTNKEFDFDQVFTAAIQPTDTQWAYPNQTIARDISDGKDTRYLLSFGPFDILPGQTLPLSFAYVGGLNFHVNAANGRTNLIEGYDPELYYSNLNFKNLGINAQWASWIYDNPGIDTDGDGDSGKFRVCVLDSVIDSIDTVEIPPDSIRIDTFWQYLVADTLYYEGDGKPDFRGASPPPAPIKFVDGFTADNEGSLRVRFNGYRSETTRDIFSRKMDFEGYRIYLSRDDRSSSYSLLVSYDREDYNKYVFNRRRLPSADFELQETDESPYSLARLRELYGGGDTTWHPLDYTRSNPYVKPGFPDSIFFFETQDYNYSDLSGPLHKVYPNQDSFPVPPDSILGWVPNNIPDTYPDSLRQKYFDEQGYPKYYQYEFTIGNLLPSVPYYVNVTAFDFGSPSSGLPSLESSKTVNPTVAFPLPAQDQVAQDNLKVFVYPNPYRIDGGYNPEYEGRSRRTRVNSIDRQRLIHFANLPGKCKISIYTLDGDLVREIDHDPDSDRCKSYPEECNATHDVWDMITRNTQMVVSGIYYWTVEDTKGNVQIGKLVVIM